MKALDDLPPARQRAAIQLRAYLRATGAMIFVRGNPSWRPARDLVRAGLAERKMTKIEGQIWMEVKVRA